MSGHNKWANIKQRKGAQDAKRSNLFSKIVKEMIVAARTGGGDPATNIRLRAAMDKARAANMPKDNIERAIKRGTGELEGVSYEEIIYEGYGPGGVAMIMDILTDNKNRTAAEVRKIFSKHNGNLGEAGCVAWMFDRKGVLVLEGEGLSEDEVMEAAIEAGADDVVNDGGEFSVYSDVDAFSEVRENMEKAGYTIRSADLERVPQNKINMDDESKAKTLIKLMDELESHDDVQSFASNADIDDEMLEKIMSEL